MTFLAVATAGDPLLKQLLSTALIAGIGLLMVRVGAGKGRLESRQRTRWCAACHRRYTGARCDCGVA